jgi:hypothetical protein
VATFKSAPGGFWGRENFGDLTECATTVRIFSDSLDAGRTSLPARLDGRKPRRRAKRRESHVRQARGGRSRRRLERPGATQRRLRDGVSVRHQRGSFEKRCASSFRECVERVKAAGELVLLARPLSPRASRHRHRPRSFPRLRPLSCSRCCSVCADAGGLDLPRSRGSNDVGLMERQASRGRCL